MYSKIRETASFSHSDDSDSGSNKEEGTDSDTDTNTTSDYDSPTAAFSSQKSDSHLKGKASAQRRTIQISKAEIPSKQTNIKPSKEDIGAELTHTRRKNAKERKNKLQKGPLYTYETIIGIHLYKTSTLKFKKYIRAPRVKVSIFEIKNRSLVRKSDVNRNVVINMEPAHVDYILPILSKEGRLNDDGSFSFVFDENLIVNEDIHHIKDDNIVITFEVMDTVVTNFKTRWKMRNSDGWHHICWAFFKLKSSSESFLNKRRTLQLYKYRKSKRNASILELWSDDNRKKYPGTLEVAIEEVKYQQEQVELSRPHTALQKDKHNSEVSTEQQNTLTTNTTLEQDDEGNFIIAGTSRKSGVEFKTKAEKMLPLIKFRNFFRWRVKFECPTQEMIRKQLPFRCLVCRFSRDGNLLAYTVKPNDEVAATDIVIAQVPSLVQQYILKGHTRMVNSLQWIPSVTTYAKHVDKQVLLSSSEDHTCILWFLAIEGSYSLEVLPHSCPIFSADFIHTSGATRHYSSDESLTIATGGNNAVIYIWRLDIRDSIRQGYNDKLQSPKAHSVQCQRQVHLQQEISMHAAYIVSIACSREFPRMYTGDKNGTVLEWCEETLLEGEIRSPSWINSRSFRLPDTLRSLQIIDKLNQGCSVLYASTTASMSSGRGDLIGTLHKIDTRTGYQCEITTRNLPTSMVKSTTFNFVLTNFCATDASHVLFTSDANKITCLNLKSDTEETIGINLTRTSTSTNTKIKHSTTGCIKTIDFTIIPAANDSTSRSILAVSLSSAKQLHGNYIILYGSGASQRSSKTADLTTSKNTGHGFDASNMRYGSTNSSSSSDCKNVSRLTSFFNEVLDKCDRIIRHGSTATNGYKLAQVDDGNSVTEANGNDDDVDSDRTSIKSNGTFTIENLSVNSRSNNSDNQFGNTFSINERNEKKIESSEANDNTFVIDKPKPVGRSSHVDDTDVSEDMESVN